MKKFRNQVMPSTIFTEGKHVSFELMMQQVPRSHKNSDESEIHSKSQESKTKKVVNKNVESVWLTNLTKYSSSNIAKQISFELPATEDEIKVALLKIEVGVNDEFFTPDSDSPYLPNLRDYLGAFENINKLNLLA